MKKFVFSLKKLKTYREQILDSEKNTLGVLRSDLNTLNEELDSIIRLIDEKNDELQRILRIGARPIDIATRKRYIATLNQEMVMKRGQIRAKEKDIERQLQVVISATQDVSTLEKLEESQLEEYNALVQKEEEQFIEEFVTSADFRKSKQD